MQGRAEMTTKEAIEAGVPIAEIIQSLTEEQQAALCRGEPVATSKGTLFPMITRLPSSQEPIVTAILSRMTQEQHDDLRAKNERFKTNLVHLLAACAHAAPEAMPAIKELLESYREYDNAMTGVVDTVIGDFVNMHASYSILPAITIRAERGSAANKRHRSSAAGKAKVAAAELWPEANRKGWTAARLHTELVSRGHTVSQGRVAKWVTNLRKTGRC